MIAFKMTIRYGKYDAIYFALAKNEKAMKDYVDKISVSTDITDVGIVKVRKARDKGLTFYLMDEINN